MCHLVPPEDGSGVQYQCPRGFGCSLVLSLGELGDQFAHAQVPAVRFRQQGEPAGVGILEAIDGLLGGVELADQAVGGGGEAVHGTGYGTLVDYRDIAPTTATRREQEDEDQDGTGRQGSRFLHGSPPTECGCFS